MLYKKIHELQLTINLVVMFNIKDIDWHTCQLKQNSYLYCTAKLKA